MPNRGVLLAVWYGYLWADFSPIRMIQFEKSFIFIPMIFDELSHGGFNFSVRPRDVRALAPTWSIFGSHHDRNYEKKHQEASQTQPNDF